MKVKCNMCGNIMSLLEDESIYVCFNSECTRCYEEYKEEPKQETLEEAAEIFVKNRFTKQICNDESYPDIYASKAAIVESHILFAKWQQERSYSEEDMKKMYKAGYQRGLRGLPIQDIIEVPSKEWFEQFKKK